MNAIRDKIAYKVFFKRNILEYQLFINGREAGNIKIKKSELDARDKIETMLGYAQCLYHFYNEYKFCPDCLEKIGQCSKDCTKIPF